MSNPMTLTVYPASHSNQRTEWRLNQARGYTNLRLAGLGAVTTGAGAQWCDPTGVYGLFGRVALVNGSDVLDEVQDAFTWLSFSQLRRGGADKDNGLDYSLYSQLSGSSRSYALDQIGGTRISHLSPRAGSATQDASTTFQGWIHVNALLGLLSQLPILDTNVFPELRLVVEWRSSPASALFMGDASAVTSVTVLAPLLLADTISDAEMPSQAAVPPAVTWNRLLLEKIMLPGGADPGGANTTTVDTRVRLLAASGRMINRVVLLNVAKSLREGSVVAKDRLKGQGSDALEHEVIQLVADGQNVLPFSGVDTPARKLAQLWSSWGTMTQPMASNLVISTSANGAIWSPLFDDADAGAAVGRQSFGGVTLARRVSELQLIHQRQLTSVRYADNIQLNLYYEAGQVMSFTRGGGYIITFA